MLITDKRKTLKSQVALCSVLLGLVLLLGIGLFTYYQAYVMLKQHTSRHLSDVVARIGADLDERVLLRKKLLLQAVSLIPQTEIQHLPTGAEHILAQLKVLSPLFDAFVIYDKDGNIITDYPVLLGRRGKNVADREYFRLTKQQKKPRVSLPIQIRDKTNRYVIVFTVPLLDSHGQFAGMLGGTLELFSKGFFRDLAMISIGKSGYITVNTTQPKLTIFHPNASKIMSPFSDENAVTFSGIGGAWNEVDETVVSGGQEMLSAYYPMRQVEWVVAGWIPFKEAYRPIRQLAERYSLFGIGVVLLLLPFSVWWVKRALRPLDVLKTQVEALKRLPQTELPPISGYQELQSVADVINRVWSEQRVVEARLVQREAFFRALNDASPFGIFVIAEDGVIDYVNDACQRLGGKGGPEWLGQHWLDIVHSEDRDRLRQMGREVFAGYRDDMFTRCRIAHAKQSDIRVEVRLARVQSGTPTYFLGIVTDITEQEATRVALSTERERASAILRSIGDAVILTNHLDEIEFLNSPAEHLLGKKATEILGCPLYLLVAFSLPDHGLPVSMAHLETLAGQAHRELDMTTPEVGIRPVVLTLSVITAQDNMHGYRVYVLRDDSARRERERAHRWEANHDPLTGLLNRRGYLSALSSLLSSPSRGEGNHVVVLMDLDHFKAVNDIAGHLTGDRLLQDIANIIQTRLRSTDVAARLGGDEFALLLYNCPVQDAMVLLEDIRLQIESHNVTEAEHRLSVTGSFGLTLIQGGDSIPSELLERADDACYRAKHGGRNRLVTC